MTACARSHTVYWNRMVVSKNV